MDSITISSYFISYPEKLKGYRFYCPNHSTRIVESGNARFIEYGKDCGSVRERNVHISESKKDLNPSGDSIPVDGDVSIILARSQTIDMEQQ